MKKEHNHPSHHHYSSGFTGKLGIVFLGIGILVLFVAGYSYFGGSKGSSIEKNIGTCPMLNTANTTNQVGGCGMMGNGKTTQTSQTQNTVQTQNTTTTATNGLSETITMNYNESGLEPSVVNVQVGKSYTISIQANTDVYGCMSTITIPRLDDTMQIIRKGKTLTFHITPTTVGEYEFLCAMGVSHNAKIVVK